MKISLSNSVIKAFRKKSKYLSFHLKTHLIISSSKEFRLLTDLYKISCYFILPNNMRIEFKGITIPLKPIVQYEGKKKVYELQMHTVSTIKEMKQIAAKLYLSLELNLSYPKRSRFKTLKLDTVIVKMYDG